VAPKICNAGSGVLFPFAAPALQAAFVLVQSVRHKPGGAVTPDGVEQQQTLISNKTRQTRPCAGVFAGLAGLAGLDDTVSVSHACGGFRHFSGVAMRLSYLMAGVLIAAGAASPQDSTAQTTPHNVVIVVTDGLRARSVNEPLL
jgi:hypothetical protein